MNFSKQIQDSIFQSEYFSKSFLISLLVLLVYLSPNIFFPHKAQFLIHDNLDSNVVWYKNLAESGYFFDANDCIIPNSMGGVPRGCYFSEFNVSILIYYLFSPLTAYNLNIILIHLIAFLSMYVFNKRYVFRNTGQTFNAVVSLSFAVLPFWPSGGLSIAGQPLLLYAFLNILNYDLRLKNWLIVVLIPFYSILAFSNLFFCILLFLLFIIYCFRKKKINFYFILALIAFVIVSVLVDYRLFLMQFIEKFESHRSVGENFGTLNFFGVLGVSFSYFLYGQFHVHSCHYPFTLIILSIAFIFIRSCKEKKILLGLLALSAIIAFVFKISDWKAITDLLAKVQLLKVFQLRFYVLSPLIWSIILSFSVLIVTKYKPNFSKLVIVLLISKIGFQFFDINVLDYQGCKSSENSFYNTYICSENSESATFKSYYQTELFDKVKSQFFTKDYVGCIGIVPEVAQFNGFNTIDGYFYYYPKKHNIAMTKISKMEMDKAGIKMLGNLCNLVSKDYIDNKSEITDLDFDYAEMKRLGLKYILSDRKIMNENLISYKHFTYSSVERQIHVYKLSNE